MSIIDACALNLASQSAALQLLAAAEVNPTQSLKHKGANGPETHAGDENGPFVCLISHFKHNKKM